MPFDFIPSAAPDVHVTPAYGRDYKSKAAALADWQAGKDFASISGYCSIRDFKDSQPPVQVWIRYNKMRNIVRAQ